MVHILVTMMIKEGRMKEFIAVCEELRPMVLMEKGCLAYEYTREIASPLGIQEPIEANRITLIERWDSLEALKAHMEAPHMKEVAPKVKELRSSVVARVLEPIC
jgi:quinol monooxygenase YgiN